MSQSDENNVELLKLNGRPQETDVDENEKEEVPQSQTDDESNKLNIISNKLNPDLMLQIFVRVPDCRSIIRCSAVHKHWYSLLNSLDYGKIKRFQSKSRPFTFIFRSDDSCEIFLRLYEYFSKNSQSLHGIESSSLNGTYLGFLPWRIDHILSAFDDLVLLSPDLRNFVICNPLTREWIKLPQPPIIQDSFILFGGLVFEPGKQREKLKLDDQYRYRVMLFWCKDKTPTRIDYYVTTFCSETSKWSRSNFSFFNNKILNDVGKYITCNGMLYSLEEDRETKDVERIVAFDPFKDSKHPKYCRFIKRPLNLLQGKGNKALLVRLGVVQERLRLSQLIHVNESDHFHLKVWELNYDNDADHGDDIFFPWTWTLVHDVRVKGLGSNELFVIAFHPDDGNVIFLVGEYHLIYQYDIGREKMEKIGKLPYDETKTLYPTHVHTLVHPLWPTPIRVLRSPLLRPDQLRGYIVVY